MSGITWVITSGETGEDAVASAVSESSELPLGLKPRMMPQAMPIPAEPPGLGIHFLGPACCSELPRTLRRRFWATDPVAADAEFVAEPGDSSATGAGAGSGEFATGGAGAAAEVLDGAAGSPGGGGKDAPGGGVTESTDAPSRSEVGKTVVVFCIDRMPRKTAMSRSTAAGMAYNQERDFPGTGGTWFRRATI